MREDLLQWGWAKRESRFQRSLRTDCREPQAFLSGYISSPDTWQGVGEGLEPRAHRVARAERRTEDMYIYALFREATAGRFKIFMLTPGDTREASRTLTKHVPYTHTCTHNPGTHACNTRPRRFKIFILTPGRTTHETHHAHTTIVLR